SAVRPLVPAQRECAGPRAALLLTRARRATRADAQGRVLLLEEQARSQWDRAVIAEGAALVPWALRGAGRFALQAAIAALHAEAPSYAQTDWPQIVALYDALLRVWSSPVVALNRAVALAMAHGPAVWPGQIRQLRADHRP